MKCALEVEESRAYWQETDGKAPITPQEAFDAQWFGARSLPHIKVLLVNLRARFDAFAPAPEVLHRWHGRSPDTRTILCHFNLQLSDPLYRKFTGSYLDVRRRGAARGDARSRHELGRRAGPRALDHGGNARWGKPRIGARAEMT